MAEALEGHAKLARVIYPGLPPIRSTHWPRADGHGGTVIALDLAGRAGGGVPLPERAGIVTISNNLGDAKSIITHPAPPPTSA
jgi:O-succinylhomoserine sulfhydrylase